MLVDSGLGENPYTASGFSMISLAAFGLSIGLCSYLNLVPLPLLTKTLYPYNYPNQCTSTKKRVHSLKPTLALA